MTGQHDAASDGKVIVASSDTHVGPRPADLRGYCEQRYLDDFDAFASTIPAFVETRSSNYELEWDRFLGDWHHDVTARLGELDRDGVAAEVVFHGSQNGQPLPFHTNDLGVLPEGDDARHLELAAAGLRIYNRWLADFCSVQPERHAGLAHLPLWDMDATVREVEWARARGPARHQLPRTKARALPTTTTRTGSRCGARAKPNAMPLDTHSGNRSAVDGLAAYDGPGARRMWSMDMSMFTTCGLAWMLVGGVFDRHPALQMGLTEIIGGGLSEWLPNKLLELDEMCRSKFFQAEELHLDKLPSESFVSNCFIGASFMSRREARAAVEHGYEQQFLWGSDFPHRESTYPWSLDSLRMTMDGLDPDTIRRFAGGNLIEVFGLDEAKLQVVADRIGPTLGELRDPVDVEDVPFDDVKKDFTLGFRKGLAWL